jgi:hypothetical protein
MEKIKNPLVQGLKIIFSEASFRIMIFFLIFICVLAAVAHGAEGKYFPEMLEDINWIMWLGIVLGYSYSRGEIQKKSEIQDTYIKSLEDYKTLSDDQVKALKDLVQAYKDRCENLETLVEDHKKLAALNDKIIKKNEKIIDQYKSSKESRF